MIDPGVAFVALFNAAMGVLALAAPAWLMGLFRVEVRYPEGRNEISAVYGGFGLAVAAALTWAGMTPGPFADGVQAMSAAGLIGMAGGRVINFVRDRSIQLWPSLVFVLVELALAWLVAPAGRPY